MDREYLKSDYCIHQEVEFLKIMNNLENSEKYQGIGAFQCPPTRLVNEPFFLTDGEEENGKPTLYLLQRKSDESKVNVIAHITDVPLDKLKNMEEMKEKTNEDIIVYN